MTNATIIEMKKVLDLQKQLHVQEGPPECSTKERQNR